MFAAFAASQEAKSTVAVFFPSSTVWAHDLRRLIAFMRPGFFQICWVSTQHKLSSPSPIESAINNKDGAGIAGMAESTALDEKTTGPPRRDALAALAVARRETVESFIIVVCVPFSCSLACVLDGSWAYWEPAPGEIFLRDKRRVLLSYFLWACLTLIRRPAPVCPLTDYLLVNFNKMAQHDMSMETIDKLYMFTRKQSKATPRLRCLCC